VSRTSRVPYHQNVYDLLGIEPAECPEAARMIAKHEAQHGPLPTSVREWYLMPNVVGVDYQDTQRLKGTPHPFWCVIGYSCESVSIAELLNSIHNLKSGDRGTVIVLRDEPDMIRWRVKVRTETDPRVRVQIITDPDDAARWEWRKETDPFSHFLSEWVAAHYPAPGCKYQSPKKGNQSSLAYVNGLWLRTLDAPFQPPVIDFLTDRFGEPQRTARPGDVTTYAFRPDGGTIRVTADEPSLTGGLSAWWVHAEAPERLAEFARLLFPWGTLRDSLRADTDPAREVRDRVRGTEPRRDP
jgi:hypothetical protein